MSAMLGIISPHIIVSNLLIIFAFAGALLLFTRAARLGRLLATSCIILIMILGFSPVGNSIRWLLETRFPAWNISQEKPDGIVVLAGAVERINEAALLARRYPGARIVFSGGNVLADGKTEADIAAHMFERLGIPRERIQLERRARNTAENAKFSKTLVQPMTGERWLLVTTALHMPRAVGAFRQADFPIQAYPIDRRISDAEAAYFSPSFVVGLRGFDVGMYEWLGLLGYWLTGRSSELFPKPVN